MSERKIFGASYSKAMLATDSLTKASETKEITAWPAPPPETFTLERDEVHVWGVFLSEKRSRLPRLAQSLSADEQARAERFRFEKDREQFCLARGLLRLILGRYLEIEPSRLQFRYNDYGKPAVAGSLEDAIRFNLSHAQGLVLYAFTHGREIGLDLERVRADVAFEKIAAHAFSPREIAALHALPEALRRRAFFTCWTRKEAYVKARSTGLSLPLDHFDVSLMPGETAVLLNVSGDAQESSRWSLKELLINPSYVATLAVEGHDWRLKCLRF